MVQSADGNTPQPPRPPSQARLRKLLEALEDRISAQVSLAERLIFQYGTAEAISRHFRVEHFVHDYVWYCFTKAWKSMKAVSVLLAARLPEDTMTITRTIYEDYLHLAYLIEHQDKVEEFVQKPIGLSAGRYRPAISKNGKRIPGRIVDTVTGQEIAYGITTRRLVAGTRYPEDQSVHQILYSFLSEHIHPHMMGSGNYRDQHDHYSTLNEENILQAALYAEYVAILLLAEAPRLEFMSERQAVKAECRAGASLITRTLKVMTYPDQFVSFPGAVQKRVERQRHFLRLARESPLKR